MSVAAAITWDLYEAEIKQRLGVELDDTSSDARLQRLLDAACAAADEYLGNAFDGSSDLSPLALPGGVVEGVLVWLDVAWTTGGGSGAALVSGVTRVKTGQLEVAYGSAGGGGFSPGAARLAAAAPFWEPWRCGAWR